MRRAPRRQHGDENALVDLAFAVMGPMAALMIVFLVLYLTVRPDGTPTMICRNPDPDQVAQLGEQLGDWYRNTQSALGVNRTLISERCDAPALAVDVFSPPDFAAGLCPEARTAVFDAAGVTHEEVSDLARQYAGVGDSAVNCLRGSDVVLDASAALWFANCSERIVDRISQSPLPAPEIRQALLPLVREIEQTMNSGEYNRLDVLGHTDQRRIQNACGRAQDNTELSVLRAVEFRRQLISTIVEEAEFLELNRRIESGALTLFPIGYGSSLPAHAEDCPGSSSEAQDECDRRIEIRLAFDGQLGHGR